jgi:hypothetical protein
LLAVLLLLLLLLLVMVAARPLCGHCRPVLLLLLPPG